ncbi:two-component system C4-dicarboxylate transport response regulator DctD [Pseudochelatococcus lubricantis]|uniref:Two-component system C4-dicarboxylate transport response regulator DctD n=1 Tax=Pseudochelatococcus lubricantis TaxID=1538102 RepID=A0ABX0V3A9_9HYPH|nr:sigma-54 dependent transcriptional regulator [Pseudochelatococcus lubricantis]NIJ58835.1 two-component system C4-dicarboxylate transport response regulator DctD [Pseudochelatococcus lubricantis]
MLDHDVLVIEDDEDVRLGCLQALALHNIKAIGYEAVENVPRAPMRDFPGIIVSDINLPGMDGLSYFAQLKDKDPDLPVIMITGHGDIATAVQAMRDGAYDFIEKPFASQHFASVVQRALEKRRLAMEVRRLRRQLAAMGDIESRIVGTSQAIVELRELVQELAAVPTDVMILGETGTGKELIARYLHDLSGRKGPFVALNCGGLPETLFESEIFGHEAGAFSGATKQRIGKVEYANRGTLFLDEIESMPMSMQVKLLRVLQERVVERLGSNKVIPVDFRVIAATKADLLQLSVEGKFRSDLHFRLNIASIELPPLRNRREDIPLLFEHFVDQAALRLNREPPPIREQVILDLMAHNWPGNVRELRNQAERFLLGLKSGPGSEAGSGPISLTAAVESFERSLIQEELKRNNGNISRTAEAMMIAKTTLFDKIRKYDIRIRET